MSISAYKVEIETAGCAHCMGGETYIISLLDGSCTGTIFEDKEQAQEVCAELNDAFNSAVKLQKLDFNSPLREASRFFVDTFSTTDFFKKTMSDPYVAEAFNSLKIIVEKLDEK